MYGGKVVYDHAKGLSPGIIDKVGLAKAYQHPEDVYVSGDTLYISGTHSFADVLTDATIPMRILDRTPRYRRADEKLRLHPEIRYIVGHSLGAAIGTRLIERHMERPLQGRMYASPTIFPHKNIMYFRHYGDPISAFNMKNKDLHQTHDWQRPHAYGGAGFFEHIK